MVLSEFLNCEYIAFSVFYMRVIMKAAARLQQYALNNSKLRVYSCRCCACRLNGFVTSIHIAIEISK